MLFVESRISESRVEEALRLPLLERLQERGLSPLIRSVRLHCYETALLGQDRAQEMEQALAAWAAAEDDSQYVRGDIFCFEEFALFLIFDGEDERREGLCAGIVYEGERSEARKELNAFCRNVSEALTLVRERSAAGQALETIEWRAGSPEELPGAASFGVEREVDATSGRSEMPLEAARALEALEETGARRLLRRVREAHADGSVAALLSSLKGKTETEALLRRLAERGLLRRELVISCRKLERALFRLPSPDALAAITASSIICSECGADIADEKIEELFAPTSMAATLLEDGSWLASRLRSTLLRLGVPEEHIAAGPIAGDGEAYVIAGVCREPFLFALKDGDVTLAQARHALAKQNETEATHLVVVATGKIHEDARARLREQARRRSRSDSLVELLLIEGVETAASELEQAFERVSNRVLADELSSLDASLGLSVGQMLATRFRLMRRPAAVKDLGASAVGALAASLNEF
ncbi:MAG: hypothetical protein QOF02_2959 [Blastocatellia bacterium]|jgi:hypothetical protein|nr:hypothetical protein [Blastocatellia bacterium]